MFQKNFVGVKYLTLNFQKKRHPAVLSQKGLSQTQKTFKLPPKCPAPSLSASRAPPRSPAASPASAAPQTNLKTNASIAYTIVAAKTPFAVLSLCELI